MKKFLKYSQPRCHACFQHISPLAPADFSEMRMMTVKCTTITFWWHKMDLIPFQHLHWAWYRPVAFLEPSFQLNRPKHIFPADPPSDNELFFHRIGENLCDIRKPLRKVLKSSNHFLVTLVSCSQRFSIILKFPCHLYLAIKGLE